ncbi:ABC transporter ATP-binding protein [Desulfobacula sp.]|uniref:ABC transporter ATP-binding protein n=1 Tax=Desulfobacula sp. TaxID=2593537 RepID=UPI002634C697|nr:ABC transporter ATP-binding protein [Desulfobacula sp.]
MTALLEVKNIETYYDLVYAIRGASFAVEEGSITAILGNNGAGKSTILKTIMALIKDQPEKGVIEFDGVPIQNRDTDEIVRKGIAYVPEGREIFEELTVHEHLLMGAYLRKDTPGVKQDIEKVFAYFPVLKQRTHQWAGTLSGGEQQMLAIGRALMLRPRLMILDEPSLGLSPILVKEIFAIIREINLTGTTILLVEQNANMALSISGTGLILENGRFVMKGNSTDLLEDKDVKEFYLGIKSETSAKGYQRWKRKKAWR